MPPFTTLEEVRAYARLNFPKLAYAIEYYTLEEKAHSYVWSLCKDTMTMELLYTTLYRSTYKYPYSVAPCVHAVYDQYLQAMQLGKKHDAL